MRQISNVLIFTLLLAIFGSCTEQGEGPMQNGELEVPYFTGINSNINGEITVQYGETQQVLVTGQQNVINALSTQVDDDGVWELKLTSDIEDYFVYISIITPDFGECNLSGNTEANLLDTQTTKGKLSLELEDNATLYINDASKITKELDIEASGNTTLQCSKLQTKEIETELSGNAKMYLEGYAATISSKLSGYSNLGGYSLMVNSATIKASGDSEMSIICQTSLNAETSGSSVVYYSGNPPLKNIKSTGSSSVVDID